MDEAELELVARATRGDLAAFERLVETYQRAVFHIALFKSKNYFDAEDLTQDIFVAAFQALPSLKAPESFPQWLFGIAYNRCHKWFRRQRTKVLKMQEIRERALERERRRQRPSAIEAARFGGANGRGDDHLSELVRNLPDDIRQALVFKYLEGLSYDEISKRLGVNFHRVDYLIRKGKALLRERWKREAGDDLAGI